MWPSFSLCSGKSYLMSSCCTPDSGCFWWKCVTSSDCWTVSRGISAVPIIVSQIRPLFHSSTTKPDSRWLISLWKQKKKCTFTCSLASDLEKRSKTVHFTLLLCRWRSSFNIRQALWNTHSLSTDTYFLRGINLILKLQEESRNMQHVYVKRIFPTHYCECKDTQPLCKTQSVFGGFSLG